MSKKAVLVTGGARRVGAEICIAFAKAGYNVALHYNHSEDEAHTVAAQVRADGVACELFQQDLSDITALPDLMQRVLARFPECNTLINNASVFERAEFLETDEALFDRQMDVNFKSPFFLTQAFAKQVGEGSVVNMLDTQITTTQPSHFAYLLSKKSLAEFTRMAARVLGPAIRVNAVCPGILLPSGDLDDAYMAKMAAMVPLRATARVEDVARVTLSLSENSALSGQFIFVDGGAHVL